MIASLLDHIWQSSVFAAAIGLLAFLLRSNRAALRFRLWFAASLKFLLPFAGLTWAGECLSRLFPASLPKTILAIQPAAERFSAPARALAAHHGESYSWAPLLLGVWLLGFATLLILHTLRWRRLRGVMASAHAVALPGDLPVAVKASTSMLEPGLVGIFKPAVLFPQGLMALLSVPERESILAHEFSHHARRDNVTAACHMAVEALFWFYPPVWLIGARLVAERERACDENVLASGHDPEVYAGGILKVCKFCIPSPLPCASGVSGADLKRRLQQIMTAPAAMDLSVAKQLLLAGAGLVTLLPPVMAGFPGAPLAVERPVIAVQARAEQAITAVAERLGMAPLAPVTVRTLPRLKLQVAAALPQPAAVEAAPQPGGEASVPDSPPAAAVTAVAAGAPLSPPPPAKQVMIALNPTGNGDPDAVTCRVPQTLPGSRLPGPQVCRTNRVWATLRANREDISPDGAMIVYLEDFQRQRAMASNCRTYFSGGNVSIMAGPSTTFCF